MTLIFALAIVGCEDANKAMETVDKAKELADSAEKKMADTKTEFDKTLGKSLGTDNKKRR